MVAPTLSDLPPEVLLNCLVFTSEVSTIVSSRTWSRHFHAFFEANSEPLFALLANYKGFTRFHSAGDASQVCQLYMSLHGIPNLILWGHTRTRPNWMRRPLSVLLCNKQSRLRTPDWEALMNVPPGHRSSNSRPSVRPTGAAASTAFQKYIMAALSGDLR